VPRAPAERSRGRLHRHRLPEWSPASLPLENEGASGPICSLTEARGYRAKEQDGHPSRIHTPDDAGHMEVSPVRLDEVELDRRPDWKQASRAELSPAWTHIDGMEPRPLLAHTAPDHPGDSRAVAKPAGSLRAGYAVRGGRVLIMFEHAFAPQALE